MSELPAPSSPPSERPPTADAAVSGVELTVAAHGAEDLWRPGAQHETRRVGQLTVGWQIITAVSWAAAFFAFAGVWKASEEIGIATWWLGPRADPQPILVRIIPFVLCVAVCLCAIYNVRRFPWISLGGSAAAAVIAALDISNSGGLALAQFAIAGSLALVSLASFGGRYVAGPASGDDARADAGPTAPLPPAAGTDTPA